MNNTEGTEFKIEERNLISMDRDVVCEIGDQVDDVVYSDNFVIKLPSYNDMKGYYNN